MATYPQGVSSFIPDYQPYQPDFNFAANVMQLKQTQYDQNWQRLNNIYGQILNAPLTHDESVKRRDNTVKRIDFDLRRITGLDLSLEQNVQQATQLFRPFYEDKNLMRDMVFTKNVGFERALGEGKRISTDEKVNKEYWDGGLRAIDYKVQEFKETPYDQLTSVGDAKYTPYVNVEKEALELATKLKLNIKRTTPQGDWMITEKNGEPAIPLLQSVFYAALGKDPKVKDMYATQAYLERKDYVMGNKDNPEFGGNSELAEKKYLNNTLTMLQKQTKSIRTSLLSEKKVNDKMISKIEESIRNGTDSADSKTALERYKEANIQLGELLKQNEDDTGLITDNVNKTLTTTGGSSLSKTDINQLRARVDAVTASTLLQADLDKAARDFAYMNYEQTFEANPFSVMKQKYLYDSSLIKQRADAQKDVAYYKYLLDFDKKTTTDKLDSGLYYKDPVSGEVKMYEELANVLAMSDLFGSTDSKDPQKVAQTVNDIYTGEANSAKLKIVSVLDELNKEGVISNRELYQVLKDPNFSGFNMKPIMNWIKANKNESADKPMDPAMRNMLMEEGMYTTKLELEDELANQGPAFAESRAKLSSMARGSLDDVSPQQITNITKRLTALIEKKKDNPNIRNSSSVAELIKTSYVLDDYAAFREQHRKEKIARATEIKDKLKADGFKYAEFLFNEDLDFVATAEEFKQNVAKWNPDHLVKDDGMTWGGFANTVALSAGTAATTFGALGLIGGPTAGITATAGFLGGAISGAVGYLGSGLIDMAWNAFNDEPSNFTLADPSFKTGGGARTVEQEFDGMLEDYQDLVDNSLLTTPNSALYHTIGSRELNNWQQFKNTGFGQFLGFREEGTGLYNVAGAGITIEPGVVSPTFHHFLEIQKTLRNLNLNDSSGKNGYVTFTGVNSTPDDDNFVGSIDNNREIFNAIFADVSMKATKKGQGLSRFQVGISPVAGGDGNNAAVVYKLPEEYLKKFAPTKDANKLPGLDSKAYENMLANGITVITDARNLQDIAIYRNSYRTPEQIRIEKSGDKGVSYKDPLRPNYEINFKTDNTNPNLYSITTTFPVYDPQQRKMVLAQNVENLSNMGTNIRMHREKFFSEFARDNDMTENELRRRYER
jgi:hypothetical protein